MIPDNVVNLIKEKLNEDDASLIISEMNDVVNLEFKLAPQLIMSGRTEGDWNVSIPDLRNDYRPGDALDYNIIEQMVKSAPVRFVIEMKRAQVVSVFRNERSWKIHSPDEELAEIVRANLVRILPKMALDFSYSALVYGVSFQELVWEYKNKYELGLSDTKYQSNKKYVVAKIPNSVNPSTVSKILRTLDGSFDGFVQKQKLGYGDIVVQSDSALVIPYNEKFRNLWGESFLKPIYPVWFWYEIVLRAMVKYMERMGTPVALVKAPSKGIVRKPGTANKIDAISWGMEIASNISRSNAAVIPSDVDEGGNALWDLSYLSSTEKSQPFLDILELLTQMILRAGLSADRALSQSSGGVGSYNIGEIHKEATALHNEMILIQWLHYLNNYFLPHYSLYNKGLSGPPISLETQGLDPQDRENLTRMLAVAGSTESFAPASNQVDWETLLGINNIPLISKEEAEELRLKKQEESLANQEETLKIQSKYTKETDQQNKSGEKPKFSSTTKETKK